MRYSYEYPEENICVYAAIYHPNGGAFYHWALFIDGNDPETQVILHVHGSTGNFQFENRPTNAWYSPHLADMVYLFNVDEEDAHTIQTLAANVRIRNEVSYWNCQDYVINLLDTLEAYGIADRQDRGYRTARRSLVRQQDGVVWR